jgi:hypothetical protein
MTGEGAGVGSSRHERQNTGLLLSSETMDGFSGKRWV